MSIIISGGVDYTDEAHIHAVVDKLFGLSRTLLYFPQDGCVKIAVDRWGVLIREDRQRCIEYNKKVKRREDKIGNSHSSIGIIKAPNAMEWLFSFHPKILAAFPNADSKLVQNCNERGVRINYV